MSMVRNSFHDKAPRYLTVWHSYLRCGP